MPLAEYGIIDISSCESLSYNPVIDARVRSAMSRPRCSVLDALAAVWSRQVYACITSVTLSTLKSTDPA